MSKILTAKEFIRILMKENRRLVRGIKKISTELNRTNKDPNQMGLDEIDTYAKHLIKKQ